MYTASTPGSARSASYEPWAFGMPRAVAAARAVSTEREARATTSHSVERCIAGITLVRAMRAAPRTPQRTLLMTPPSWPDQQAQAGQDQQRGQRRLQDPPGGGKREPAADEHAGN